MNKKLSNYIGINVFSAIAVSLTAIVGLDIVAGIIDQMGDIRRNYQFTDVLILPATKIPSTIYEYIPVSLINWLFSRLRHACHQ